MLIHVNTSMQTKSAQRMNGINSKLSTKESQIAIYENKYLV